MFKEFAMRTTVCVVVLTVVAGVLGAAVIPSVRGQQLPRPASTPRPESNWSSSTSKSGSWNQDSSDPLADNPEAAKLREAEVEAAREAQALVGQLQQALNDAARA